MITQDEDPEWVVEPPEGSREDCVVADLLFIKVPEPKTSKNRLHLDLRPEHPFTEVARLERLGATRVDVGQGNNQTWVVMADPEGNEFCSIRRRSEHSGYSGTRPPAGSRLNVMVQLAGLQQACPQGIRCRSRYGAIATAIGETLERRSSGRRLLHT